MRQIFSELCGFQRVRKTNLEKSVGSWTCVDPPPPPSGMENAIGLHNSCLKKKKVLPVSCSLKPKAGMDNGSSFNSQPQRPRDSVFVPGAEAMQAAQPRWGPLQHCWPCPLLRLPKGPWLPKHLSSCSQNNCPQETALRRGLHNG